MQLDPKGLEAARTAVADLCNTATEAVPMAHVEATVRAYLEAAPSPSPAPAVVETLQELHRVEHSKLGEMLLDKSLEGLSAANWQGGKCNGISAALASLSQPAKGEREGGGR